MILNPTQLREKLNSNEKFVLDFYATWCRPCKNFAPIFLKVENDLQASNSDVNLYKFDVDTDLDFVKSLSVSSVPTLLFYSNGNVVKKVNGVMSEAALLEEISKL
jgi:thioredoxin 1